MDRNFYQPDPNLTPQESLARYEAFRAKSNTLPRVKVSRQEFIKLAIANGSCPEKAEQTATLAEALGSEVMLGEQMVGIKADE